MESPWYQALFPNVRLNRNTANEIETDQGGLRLTTSTEGTLTGRGGDPIIIDDPMNANDGYSKLAGMQSIIGSRPQSIPLDDLSMGAIIVIMQRLHEDDLVGNLMKLGHWDVVSLPAIAPEDIEVPLSDHVRYPWKKGELLHEARLPASTLETLKQTMGVDIYNTQILLMPVPETGNMINRNWLKYYDSTPVVQQGDQVVQSWDTAMKTGVANDYSVCLTFLIRNKNEYCLLDVFRKNALNFRIF